jgi:hypothetical protein
METVLFDLFGVIARHQSTAAKDRLTAASRIPAAAATGMRGHLYTTPTQMRKTLAQLDAVPLRPEVYGTP